MRGRSRKLKLAIWLLPLLAAASAGGGWAWRSWQLERRVERALIALQQRGNAPLDAKLIQAIQDNSRYASELRFFRGVQASRAGQFGAALQAFGGLKLDGRIRIPLLLQVGEALYKSGRLSDAQNVFLQVEFEKPELALVHHWLATVFHDLGAMHASFAQLEKLAELEPEGYVAYRLMGLMNQQDFGRDQDAVENYRAALARNPPPDQLPAIRVGLAESLIGVNDFAGALEALEPAAEDATVLALRAECRWSMGETDAGWKLLEQARALSPQARVVLLLSGRMALQADGNVREAVESFQTLVDRDPHDVQARYQLSLAYQRLGDKAAAAAELDRMNESKALREKLAALYDQAMQRSTDPEVRDELADLCRKLGKPELARIWGRAAEQLRQGQRTRSSPP